MSTQAVVTPTLDFGVWLRQEKSPWNSDLLASDEEAEGPMVRPAVYDAMGVEMNKECSKW
jgi:hypothetical protein